MKNKDIIKLFRDVFKKFEQQSKGQDITKYKENFDDLITKYSKIQLEEKHQSTYDTLIYVGKIVQSKNKISRNRLNHFLRLGYSCLKDFKDMPRPLEDIKKAYIVSFVIFIPVAMLLVNSLIPGILFMVPALFIPFVILGYWGLKQRNISLMLLGVMFLPLVFLVGTAITSTITTVLQDNKYNEFISSLSNVSKVSIGLMNVYVIIIAILGSLLIMSSLLTLYLILRHRKMFV